MVCEPVDGLTSFWKGRRAFVTGATGMIGSCLVRDLLDQGASVIALIRDADPQTELYRSGDVRRVSVVNGSLEDFATLARAINDHGADTVFHLGAQTIVETAQRLPLATFEANIRGTYNLLEACRQSAAVVHRVVIASSDKAYGESTETPYTEGMALVGRYPYEVSKSCSDLIAQAYHHSYGLPVVVARCGNVYGAGDVNWSRVVPGTIRALLFGEPVIVRSDGQYVREYLYVKDVSAAYMRLAERLSDERVRGEAFNFSAEQPLTVLQIIDLIKRLMGRDAVQPEVQNRATGEIRVQQLSAAKARRLLNWSAAFDPERGLGETIDWYRAFLTKT